MEILEGKVNKAMVNTATDIAQPDPVKTLK